MACLIYFNHMFLMLSGRKHGSPFHCPISWSSHENELIIWTNNASEFHFTLVECLLRYNWSTSFTPTILVYDKPLYCGCSFDYVHFPFPLRQHVLTLDHFLSLLLGTHTPGSSFHSSNRLHLIREISTVCNIADVMPFPKLIAS